MKKKTLISSLSFPLLKSFHTKNKNNLLVDSDNFFDSYGHNVYPIYMGTCLTN